MNTKQFKGKLNQLQGNVKMAVGQTVKDPKLSKSGAKDKLKGIIQEDIGNAQEKIKVQSEKFSNKIKKDTDSLKAKSNTLREEIVAKSERLTHQVKEKTDQYVF